MVRYGVQQYTMRCITPLLLILATTTLSGAGTDNWPGWRGPSANGISLLKNIPASWSAEQNIQWKVPVPGRGHSSPPVWGDLLFLTTDTESAVLPAARAVKHRVRGHPLGAPD